MSFSLVVVSVLLWAPLVSAGGLESTPRMATPTSSTAASNSAKDMVTLAREMRPYTYERGTRVSDNILFNESFWNYGVAGRLINAGGYAESSLGQLFSKKEDVYDQATMLKLFKLTLFYANFPAAIIVMRTIQRVYPDLFATLGTLRDDKENTLLHLIASVNFVVPLYQPDKHKNMKAALYVLVTTLIEACGADVHAKNSANETALSISFNKTILARIFLDQGAVIDWCRPDGTGRNIHPLQTYLLTHPPVHSVPPTVAACGGAGTAEPGAASLHAEAAEPSQLNVQRDDFIMKAIDASSSTLTRIVYGPIYQPSASGAAFVGSSQAPTKYNTMSAGQAIKNIICLHPTPTLPEELLIKTLKKNMHKCVLMGILEGNKDLIDALFLDGWTIELVMDVVYELVYKAMAEKNLRYLNKVFAIEKLHRFIGHALQDSPRTMPLLIDIADWADKIAFLRVDNFLSRLHPIKRAVLGGQVLQTPEIYAEYIIRSNSYMEALKERLGADPSRLMQEFLHKPHSRVTDETMYEIITSCAITHCHQVGPERSTLAHLCAKKGFTKSVKHLLETCPEVTHALDSQCHTPITLMLAHDSSHLKGSCLDIIAERIEGLPAAAHKHLARCDASVSDEEAHSTTVALWKGLKMLSEEKSLPERLSFFWQAKSSDALVSQLTLYSWEATHDAFDVIETTENHVPLIVQCASWVSPDLVEILVHMLETTSNTNVLYEHDDVTYARALNAMIKFGNTPAAARLLEAAGDRQSKWAARTLCYILREDKKTPSLDVVNFLLEYKPRLSVVGHEGVPLISLLTAHGMVRLVKDELIRQPELVALKDRDGRTPLHYACRHGLGSSVRLLYGINTTALHIPDRRGKTPLDCVPRTADGSRPDCCDAAEYEKLEQFVSELID